MNDSNYKYQFAAFSMFDYRSIEDNLASMSAKGWGIDHIGAFIWRFKKATPLNKKFCVVFSKDSSDYKPMSIEKKDLLEELCNAEGWTKECQWKQMQIFSADKEALALETDEAVRLESVCASMRKSFVPSWIIGLICMLILAFSNGIKYFGDSPYFDKSTIWAFLITLYTAFIILIQLLGYMFWVKFSRIKISEGGTCISVAWHRRLLNVLLAGYLVLLSGYLTGSKEQTNAGILFYIAIYMIVVLAGISMIHFFSRYLNVKGYSYSVNIALSTITAVLLILVSAVILK